MFVSYDVPPRPVLFDPEGPTMTLYACSRNSPSTDLGILFRNFNCTGVKVGVGPPKGPRRLNVCPPTGTSVYMNMKMSCSVFTVYSSSTFLRVVGTTSLWRGRPRVSREPGPVSTEGFVLTPKGRETLYM